MTLGQRLFELRKSIQLSQEEVANRLNITRQTVSKWETNQSTPDFDKIIPLCKIYNITTNELLTGTKEEVKKQGNNEKKTIGIVIGIFLYFAAIISLIITVLILKMSRLIGVSLFLLIFMLATVTIISTNIIFKKEEELLQRQLKLIVSTFALIVYSVISLKTLAWHVTWIIWIVMILINEIINLVFLLRGKEDEK